jgi:signal transduction histidine kinase
MKRYRSFFPYSLHGLQVQVLLWIMLPLTILLMMFAFSGVNSHQNSMRELAVHEHSRLIDTLSRLLAAQVEIYATTHQIPLEQVNPSDLDLDTVLAVEHPHADGTVALIDQDGTVLFSRGTPPPSNDLFHWAGVPEVLSGQSGALFTSPSMDSDVVVYAPVPNTSWSLIIREGWHSLTDPLIRFEQSMPFILFTATATSILALFFGLRYVVRPLQDLRVQAKKIGQGQFEVIPKMGNGVQEIQDLGATLHDMARQLQDSQAALHDYLREMTETQEEERARLGRELHDETVQTLIALSHKAQMVERNFKRSSPQTNEYIVELRQMVDEAIDEVRRFSRALHPHYLDELGLVTALETLAQEVGAQFSITGSPSPLKAEKELAFYRIAQEALNNARHHAQAKHIRVEVEFQHDQANLQVWDDGVGFTLPPQLRDLTRAGHFGLMGMRERSQLVDGQFHVTSSLGKGTTIAFKVSYKTE